MNDKPEQPTPDSKIFLAEFLSIWKTPEGMEFQAAHKEELILEERARQLHCVEFKAICEAIDARPSDIVKQLNEFRFALREAGRIKLDQERVCNRPWNRS